MLQQLARLVSGKIRCPRVKCARGWRTLLTVEFLEDRRCPATLLWNGAAGANWDVAANWWNADTHQQATAAPNVNGSDSVKFEATSTGTDKSQNTNCSAVDSTPIVTNFTVDSGYTST